MIWNISIYVYTLPQTLSEYPIFICCWQRGVVFVLFFIYFAFSKRCGSVGGGHFALIDRSRWLSNGKQRLQRWEGIHASGNQLPPDRRTKMAATHLCAISQKAVIASKQKREDRFEDLTTQWSWHWVWLHAYNNTDIDPQWKKNGEERTSETH
jgi:hypothetical protein